MMPTATPTFFFPPKSMLAVPDNIPCTPMMHNDMNTISQPSKGVPSSGYIAHAPTSIAAYSTAETGPRREPNTRSEMMPANIPPRMPAMHSNMPQLDGTNDLEMPVSAA